MKTMKLTIILITSFLLLGCPGDDRIEPDVLLIYKNNSNIDIVDVNYSVQNSDLLIEDPLFERSDILEVSTVKSNSERSSPIRSSTIEENGLKIAFLSREVIETVPWEEIRENNMVLKTFDLTLEELEDLDYTLEYP